MPANPTARTLGDFAAGLLLFAVGLWGFLAVYRWLMGGS